MTSNMVCMKVDFESPILLSLSPGAGVTGVCHQTCSTVFIRMTLLRPTEILQKCLRLSKQQLTLGKYLIQIALQDNVVIRTEMRKTKKKKVGRERRSEGKREPERCRAMCKMCHLQQLRFCPGRHLCRQNAC